MSKEVKFTEEEMKQVEAVRESYNKLTVEYGQLEMQQQALTLAKESLANVYTDVKNGEKSLVDSLIKKYGNGTLNPENGVFIPA